MESDRNTKANSGKKKKGKKKKENPKESPKCGQLSKSSVIKATLTGAALFSGGGRSSLLLKMPFPFSRGKSA